jgi:hypothetical protein
MLLMGHMEALLGPVDRRLFGMREPEMIDFLFGGEAGMREVWRIFRNALISECVDRHGPGVRPAAWWKYDAPGAPRTTPYWRDQPAMLEQWGLIGPNERELGRQLERRYLARRARPDPDLEPAGRAAGAALRGPETG